MVNDRANAGTDGRQPPILVIDFGTCSTVAMIVHHGDGGGDGGGDGIPVKDPVSGDVAWPTCVHFDGQELVVGRAAEQRRFGAPLGYLAHLKSHVGASGPIRLGDRDLPIDDLLSAFFATLREQSDAMIETAARRVLITVPGSYAVGDPRRATLDRALRRAGFDEVEMVFEPVAAAYAPVVGQLPPPGATIVVYDFGGGACDAALLRLGDDEHEILTVASAGCCGGREIDERLVAGALAGQLADLQPPDERSTGDDARRRLEYLLAHAADEIKRQVTRSGYGVAPVGMTGHSLRLDRDQVEQLAAPLIDQAMQALTGVIPGDAQRVPAPVAVPAAVPVAALLVGGGSCLALVAQRVTKHTGLPILRAVDPMLAVVRGAVAWAGLGHRRFVRPSRQEPHEVPLRWTLPGDTAVVGRWLVAPGRSFDADDPILRVALSDGALWNLRAERPGVLLRRHAEPGARVRSGDWLATVSPPQPCATRGAILTTAWCQYPVPTGAVGTAGQHPASTPAGLPVAIRPDCRYAAFARDDLAPVALLDLRRGEFLGDVPVEAPVTGLALHPTRPLLVVAMADGSLRFHDLGSGAWPLRLEYPEARGNRIFLAIDAAGHRLLASSPETNVACRWSLGDGAGAGGPWECGPPERIELWSGRAHSAAVTTSVTTRDGRFAVPASRGGSVMLIDRTGEVVHRLPARGSVPAVAFAPGGDRVYLIDGQHRLQAFDTATGEPDEVTAMPHGPKILAIDHTGQILACGGTQAVLLLDAATRRERARIRIPGRCTAAAFSPDGFRLVTVHDGAEPALTVWSLTGDGPLVAADAHTEPAGFVGPAGSVGER